ncbi:Ig-like domain-containing protein [Mycolicibacterium sp. ELW1]|uniref:Ig-like domain-containing protein n=1 Tax=Mycobacteriaceae TaxID=1762 RepID=UPI0011ED4653|nr:VCBS domain-containing protein [Mycobacterium sp. ELW1]QEN12327.1 hypothetical protein D3H54_02815 [Mycobacterium sp. ELW1]
MGRSVAGNQRANRGGRLEPYGWLGLSAITLGMGAALAYGGGVAHADTTGSAAPAGASAADHGPGHATAAGKRTSSAAPAGAKDPTTRSGVVAPKSVGAPAILRRASAALDRRATASRAALSTVPTVPSPAGSPAGLADMLAYAARDVESIALPPRQPAPGHPGSMNLAASAPVPGTAFDAVVAGPIQQAMHSLVRHIEAAVATTVRFVSSVVRATVQATVVAVRTMTTAITNVVEIARHPAPYADGPTVGMPDAPTGAVTGDLGFRAPGDLPLSYTVTTAPTRGTVTVSNSGEYTYTPTQEARLAADGATPLTDTFVVTATDRFGSTSQTVTVPVAPARYVVSLPSDLQTPRMPDFTPDGKSLVFSATPQGGTRSEIYRVNVDGSGLQCLTCGLSPEVTGNLSKPFAMENGTDYLLSGGTQSSTGGSSADHFVLHCAGAECGAGSTLSLINVPTQYAAGVSVVQTREMRISPDNTHIAYTQLLASGTQTVLVTMVGTLQEGPNGYDIVDSRVVYDGGEIKSFTPDGKGVIVTDFYGRYNQGNADNVVVDLTDGSVSRLTANPDYDESANLSPNGQWLVVGSARTLNLLTPMTQIVRPTFIPAYVIFPTFLANQGTTNQAWVVSPTDELAGLNGVFLGDPTGGYVSRPVASWSPDGDAVTFWEASTTDPTQSRLVVTYLNDYGGGTTPVDTSTPDLSSWAAPLSSYVPKLPPLEPGRAGVVGGDAQVSTVKSGKLTTTTVTYTNFEDSSGYILNGTESTVANATLTSITYNADITVTDADGNEIGWLRADGVVITNQQTIQGSIESSMNGNHLVMGTPVV